MSKPMYRLVDGKGRTFPWSVALGYCTIESDNPSLSVMINDDGTLDVDYSDDEDYYTFHCVKASE